MTRTCIDYTSCRIFDSYDLHFYWIFGQLRARKSRQHVEYNLITVALRWIFHRIKTMSSASKLCITCLQPINKRSYKVISATKHSHFKEPLEAIGFNFIDILDCYLCQSCENALSKCLRVEKHYCERFDTLSVSLKRPLSKCNVTVTDISSSSPFPSSSVIKTPTRSAKRRLDYESFNRFTPTEKHSLPFSPNKNVKRLKISIVSTKRPLHFTPTKTPAAANPKKLKLASPKKPLHLILPTPPTRYVIVIKHLLHYLISL